MYFPREIFSAFSKALAAFYAAPDRDGRIVSLLQALRPVFPVCHVAIDCVGTQSATGLPDKRTGLMGLPITGTPMQLTLRRDKGFTEQERFLAGQLRAHLVSAFGKNCATPTAQPNRKTGPAELRGLGLTPRECEVLHWVIQGKSDVKIAKTIGTATRTVDKHMENILRKLGAETRLAAVRLATDRLARD